MAFGFMQDAYQIDDRITAANRTIQCRLEKHIALFDLHVGQQGQVLGIFAPPGQHLDRVALDAQPVHQVATDKARPTQYHDLFHVKVCPVDVVPLLFSVFGRCRTRPTACHLPQALLERLQFGTDLV